MDDELDHATDRDHGVTTSRSLTGAPPRRALVLASSMAMVLAGFSAAVHANDFSRLHGSWDCDEDGARSSLEFVSSTQLSFNGQPAAYELTADSILVEEAYGSVPYFYGFEEGFLVILSPDGSLTWCAKAQAPTPSQSAPEPVSGTGDGVTGDGDTSAGEAGILVPGPGWPVYERPVGTVSEDAPSPGALLYKFAGRWDHVSSNTLTNIYLMPDGTYESSYEASYSGEDGDWGAAGAEQDRGHWMIEGSLRAGTLTLVAPDGDRAAYRYDVHVSDGETYWSEYFFDGELYVIEYIYR